MDNNLQTYGVFGKGMIKNNALLTQFVEAYTGASVCVKRIYPVISATDELTAMLGWGRKKSYQRASRFAHKNAIPMLTLEDGFLRSLDSGKSSRYGCSMVIDPIGIYFDARSDSYLEQLVITSHLTQEDNERATQLILRITDERLSKYNATAKTGTLRGLSFAADKQHILLIDQVAGDQSIKGAGASKKSFAKLLKVAQKNHPNAQLWIKAHPAGKVGYLTQLALPSSICVIQEAVNPIELLEKMDAVYTVSSHMGFEALMLGKPVYCFGIAWYSAWGLTNDSHAPQQLYQQVFARRAALITPTLNQLFTACYLRYCRYVDPATGRICQIEQVIDWLSTNRIWRDKLPDYLNVYAFSRWKYPFVKGFLQTADTSLKFHHKATLSPLSQLNQITKHLKSARFLDPHSGNSNINKNSSLAYLVWGFAKKIELMKAMQPPRTVFCMEDGFIRSNGLGASLIAPLSVVIDQTGIYYNATQPSDLEALLQQTPCLTTQQQQRVANLIARLLAQQVSKYNVGKAQPLNLPTQRQRILVVGQVEDDMSVKLCASDIITNLALLQRVRADHPSAYIVYKPHPDVEAGLRTGKISVQAMQRYADQVVTDIAMPTCLDAVDSVHTISSLTGFEALLRGLSVTCYGLPFYAGWGLTTDKADNAIAQRTKQRRERDLALSLAQLVYVTLIDYPLYHLPEGYGLAQVEAVIDYLYTPASDSALDKRLLASLNHYAKHKLMQARQQTKQRWLSKSGK